MSRQVELHSPLPLVPPLAPWMALFAAAALALTLSATAQSTPAAKGVPATAAKHAKGKPFSSSQEAASALYAAAGKQDENAMLVILGPGARDLVFWTEDPADRKAAIEEFAQHYERMHRLVKEPDDETTLYVGAENWPLPVPLVEEGGKWFFDADLGRAEVLYRRVGENEMNTITVLRAMAVAEEEYYDRSASAGVPEYASRFSSSPGANNGLYQPGSADNEANPVGPYVAQANYESPERKPLHGYYLRILTGQGANAPGGAQSYFVHGKMTGGFAFVAFPAEYRSSGVMTFVVNRAGVVYEKDLGPATTKIAAAMKAYDPGQSWRRAE